MAAESLRRRLERLGDDGGPWMLGELLNWTEGLYASIPKLVGG